MIQIIHTHIYNIYVYISIHIHTYTHIYTQICIHIHIHTCTYTYTHPHTHVDTYTYTHTHTHMYIHTYIYTHIHIYSRKVNNRQPKIIQALFCFLYKTDICNVLLTNSTRTILRFPFLYSLFKFVQTIYIFVNVWEYVPNFWP